MGDTRLRISLSWITKPHIGQPDVVFGLRLGFRATVWVKARGARVRASIRVRGRVRVRT